MIWNQCFTYDAETGVLAWRERPLSHFRNRRGWAIFNAMYAGKVAGSPSKCKHERLGYIKVRVVVCGSTSTYPAHRIIWEMHNGPIANGLHIDHANGNSLDNRICNLRICTRSQNMMNSIRRPSPTSGVRGVVRRRGRYAAMIGIGRKQVWLGTYDTIEEAAIVYRAAAQRLHGDFASTKTK